MEKGTVITFAQNPERHGGLRDGIAAVSNDMVSVLPAWYR